MASNPLKIRFDENNLEQLESDSKQSGASITALVNRAVESRYTDISAHSLLNALVFPDVVRMDAGGTSTHVHNLKLLLSRKQTRRVVFGVKEEQRNDRVLVAYIEMDEITVLMDKVLINHARRPRQIEVEELFQYWYSVESRCEGLLIPEIVPDTGKLVPAEALAQLEKFSTEPFDLARYISMLSPKSSGFDLSDYMP